MSSSQSQHLNQAEQSSSLADESCSALTQEEQTLRQGRRVLVRLAKEAEAARAEARHEELRQLIEEADQGNPDGLERWLAANEFELEPDVATVVAIEPQAVSAQPATRPSTAKLAAEDTAQQKPRPTPNTHSVHLESWDELVPIAKNRLGERLATFDRAPKFAEPASKRDARAKDKLKSFAPQKQKATKPKETQNRERRSLDASKVLSAEQPNPALVQLAQLQQQADGEDQQEHSAWYKRLGGVGVSLLAHVAIIIALAFVTLNLPSDAASLALSAANADSNVEALEISESFDASEPTDVAEPTIEEPVVDASDSLADSSDSLAELLASDAPAGAPTGAADAMRAISSGAAAKMRAATSSFYGAQASGNCFCYIIDGSGSMRNGPWDAAKMELLKSLASLKPKQRFYIIFFNRDMNAIPLPGEREPAPRTLYATRENLQHAREWIETLKIDAGAPPNDALEHAIGLEPDAIYLLTDGVTKVDVPAFLGRVNRVDDIIFGMQVRVPIHTIAFYSREGEAKLRRIAAENKGQFIYVPDPRDR